jgi:hypothetical protein
MSKYNFDFSVDNIDNMKIDLNKYLKNLSDSMFNFSSEFIFDSLEAIKNDTELYGIGNYIYDANKNLDLLQKYHDKSYDYYNKKKYIEQFKNYKGSYLDIVDASYNFRKLKLRTLNVLKL